MKKNLIISLALILVDRILKLIVSNVMLFGEYITIIPSFLKIMYVQNTGAAFSILEGKQSLLIIFSIIFLIFFYIFFIKNKKLTKIENISIILIISGIIGNLWDRLFYNYVIDYISINIMNYSFPIFNFADMMIVIGFIIYFIINIKEE